MAKRNARVAKLSVPATRLPDRRIGEEAVKDRCKCCDAAGDLVVRKSSLKKGVQFALCPVCLKENHEPRWWLILFGRANGVRAVEKQVKNGLYCGKEILARELL